MERDLDKDKISGIGDWIGIGSTCWFAGLCPGGQVLSLRTSTTYGGVEVAPRGDGGEVREETGGLGRGHPEGEGVGGQQCHG